MGKTCQGCHDLKSLKKDLQTSYDHFNELAESKAKIEDNYQSRIEELEKELEYFEEAAKKFNTQIYQLQCQNESLRNQLSSQPGLATVIRYKDQMISAVREQSKMSQVAANAVRKAYEAEAKMQVMQNQMDKANQCSYCEEKLTCDCLDEVINA